jgi:hypothetical protein
VNRLVVAPSIIDRPIRPPVDTYTTRLGVAAECSREHHGQGTDRCKSRLASDSAKIARVRPLELPRGVHRVLSPHVAVQSHRFCFQGIGTARVDTRAARKPWGVGSADTLPTLPATDFSPVAAVTREKVVHRHTCRRRPDASRRRNHVARTWRGGRRIFLIRKVRATAAGTLGKRPARDLHADARVSFLIYNWTPFYLKNPIKPLICPHL